MLKKKRVLLSCFVWNTFNTHYNIMTLTCTACSNQNLCQIRHGSMQEWCFTAKALTYAAFEKRTTKIVVRARFFARKKCQ